ncbi:MAG: hypothetical protein A2233_00065 [Candidatus Kerfeldbacteria bacterium RIFOXYA2_FULL_38_24]|uniref:ABC transporter domain-containing protein n=1 Tax=Candidatus Kerfeldbacteria bacterium RIFOXYB2_FULL_38_14 TaxID=1798547 RepID=A0A1G2BBN4_9BACT|nr:MAG: hypothetical protein A2233_00065 [Candidatus Kerfeldbacteria bacterium RIFOXYA2_FULL_38_24]OGY85989.1 MAG: hypothetical protein A2319_00270 [Candidatus Kerfeldbacteria bacterium RIFOXYB2_FULL_38_14]OGY90102.1 MAG: hypothetical protein A2458_03865 [Candidatus Kerfeldbacteria bacterium RIFOXYC2_FULL_38_9]
MISVSHLHKQFGALTVLEDISFKVQKGEVLGFLGPNGAGKTTTMRIITGFLTASSGEVTIDDQDIVKNSLATRRKIGYLPENNPLYDNLRIYEYLDFIAKVKKITKRQESLRQVVKICNLEEKIAQPIADLSKGFRQRVGLAGAMLGNPDILILDEPTSGLDPNQALEIRKVISEIGKTKTIIFSTHILQEVQQICDRALIINHGKIVAAGTVAELMQSATGKTEVKIMLETLKEPVEEISAELKKINGVVAVIKKQTATEFVIAVESGKDVRSDIFHTCVKKGWVLLAMQQNVASLEDVFRQLTTEKS